MSSGASDFDPIPSRRRSVTVIAAAKDVVLGEADAVGTPVDTDLAAPFDLHADSDALRRAGLLGNVGQTLSIPRTGEPAAIAVGVGPRDQLDPTALRNAAAAFARAVPRDARLAFHVPALASGTPAEAAQAVVEGILLSRYSFSIRGRTDEPVAVTEVRLITDDATLDEVAEGAARGKVLAGAALLGRDLANCPAGILTATRIAEVAVEVGASEGLGVEVFDKEALLELGCGGLLGVNRGSTEPPRMVKLTYTPDPGLGEPTGQLALVGKGIMYDSGGINLKPGDSVHATMKNDMTGAGAVLASMSVLGQLGCRASVIGYLMCTDNMPSGSAMQLGDVITMRGGRTVEVLNTDAEGRLVMADALALATEASVDAIVDIATLTGACLRTFGPEVAGVLGNDQSLIEQVKAAAQATDEPVWQLPLDQRYRSQLDSPVADMTNMGGINAGSITAALFLAEFVADIPWAHIDIAGTAQADAPRGWVNKGATGTGTRTLIDLALNFAPVAH